MKLLSVQIRFNLLKDLVCLMVMEVRQIHRETDGQMDRQMCKCVGRQVDRPWTESGDLCQVKQGRRKGCNLDGSKTQGCRFW